MTTTAFERVTAAFEANGLAVTQRGGNRADAQAPGHSPADRSVSITGIEGQVLMHCHAGEDTADVLAAVGLTLADLFDEPKGATYRYSDGRTVRRTPEKKFFQSGNTKGRSLYHSDRIGDTTEKVFIVEGEKDVHAIESAGGVAVCSAMGAGKAHLFDWSPLAGRQVVIVADDDEPGRKHAEQVAGLLTDIAESVVVVRAATGKDAADHIAAGHSLEELVPVELTPSATVGVTRTVVDDDQKDGQTATFKVHGYEREGVIRDGRFHYKLRNGEERSALLPPEPSDEEQPGRRSVAAQLVDMARTHYRLGVTDTDDPFGVTEEHPHIALMLRGGKTGLRAELARRYFAETNTVASQQALADACCVLEGFAAQEQPQRVYLRVAERDGAVYIDTGDTAGTVIRIGGGQWELVPTAPVLFRRTKLTGELPVPTRGKGGPKLWQFVSVDPADRPILLAVLVAALVQVDVPHVILLLLAEQGSAKSTITRILVSLLDPSAVPLRQPPRDPDGWTTAASASWLVALDNLSGDIDGWLSDCLCRASTGDGSVKRQLYTDSDVAVVSFRRCVIGNGVDVAPVRGDLAERIATVKLPRITIRRAESEFEAEWEAARPEVFAALLDLAAKVHKLLPTIEVPDLPRMADFAKVLAAVDQVMKTDGLAHYRDQSRSASRDTLDVPFVTELVSAGREFTDTTSKALLAALTPEGTDWRRPKGWPKSARAVTGLLTRHAPAMRAQGWRVDNDGGANEDGITKWTIIPPTDTGEPEKARTSNPSDPSIPSAEVNGIKRDGLSGGSTGQTGYPITRPDSDNPSKPVSVNAVTSGNGVTGQTGQQNTPSLVLCGCGVPLERPESRERGCCEECAVSGGAA